MIRGGTAHMLRLVAAILAIHAGLAGSAAADAPLPVEFVQVERTNLTFDAALTGSIYAKDSVSIGFRMGGRVTEVMVREGDAVTQGQALARTDPLQQEQGVRVAEAALRAAQASLAQAQQARDRAQEMLRRGVGTRAALDNANRAFSSASGGVEQAQTSLEQARRALDDTVIRAPQDAIVIARNAEPGQIVGAAQPVISLASAEGREAVFQIADSPLLRNAIGAEVSLTVIDRPNLQMTGKVTEIAPLIDPATGSVTVRAEIRQAPRDTGLLGAAVTGAVHFPAGTGIAIPWTALTATRQGSAVWIVGEEDRVRLAPVSIGRYTNETVILTDGVDPGQIVVGAGSQLLFPGRKVRDAAQKASLTP